MDINTITEKNQVINVLIDVFFLKEGNTIVAYSPALNLTTYGEDRDDAKLAFNEAIKIFFDETQKKGTLEKILLKLGWSLTQIPAINYKPPKIVNNQLAQFVQSNRSIIKSEKKQIAIPIT